MKKLAFTVMLFLMLGTSVYAADALKIQQNGVVKRAKEIGSGNGIIFTLPDLNNADFIIDSYEMAIFEQKQADTNYRVFGSTKLIENPTSLNVTFDFGDTNKYKAGSKYKIGYRYYVRSVDDPSILEIAGQETKEGWRLVGEENPIASSATGFSFYQNSAPVISLSNISWNVGGTNRTYTPNQLPSVYLHKNALSEGITVNYLARDPDSEDVLTVYYRLVNKANGAVIADSVLGSDRKIIKATTAENINLVLYVLDNWGGRAETAPVTLKVDSHPPTITINADENTWYEPFTVTATSNDNESGIQTKQYQIGDNITGNWLDYTDGIKLSEGAIYHLHLRAVDNAGNIAVASKRIKVNSPLVVGKVKPTSDYLHTIYNSLGDVYIIKNTAFNTKFTFDTQDNDVADTIKADIRLINEDDNSIYSSSTVYVPPNGSVNRNVVFNMSYLKLDGSALPDGVYSMELTVAQIKSHGDVLTSYSNAKACEVVIKRSSPPKPQIKYEGGKLSIGYPEETLATSMNRAYIKAMYKREYKIIRAGQSDSNVYKPYLEEVTDINYDCNVTALYTDPAGNISTTSLRVFGSSSGGNGDDERKTIKRDGNSVRLEEGRPANIYYIGTRREKNVGIDNEVFKFLR